MSSNKHFVIERKKVYKAILWAILAFIFTNLITFMYAVNIRTWDGFTSTEVTLPQQKPSAPATGFIYRPYILDDLSPDPKDPKLVSILNTLRSEFNIPANVPNHVICQAINTYHEARNQPPSGKLAVMWVVKNREEKVRGEGDPCSVISQLQPNTKASASDGHLCEFNWYCDSRIDPIPAPNTTSRNSFEGILSLAIGSAYLESLTPRVDVSMGATCYHAHSYTPKYFANKPYATKIGDHEFRRCM